MKDDRERLIDSINELKTVLAASSNLDEANRRRLEHAIGEIESAIEGEALSLPHESAPHASNADKLNIDASPSIETDNSQSTLGSRLSKVTFEFEASHPRLSGALGGVVDALSRMGI
jgi:hypothetical protein